MKILLVGGGTGGHITPLLAVAHELKVQAPDSKLIYVLEKGNKFTLIINENKNIDELLTIRAGKFRRYHGESILKQVFDIPTVLLNIRDFFYVIAGIFQSLKLIKKVSPDIVFIKGGFVAVPIGLACRFWRIKYITHDSDVVAGLANRLISKGAVYNATGMPEEFYNYPKEKVRYVGIPLSSEYHEVTTSLKNEYRVSIEVPVDADLISVTGGSLGAVRLNNAFAAVASRLLEKFPKLYIFHQAGDEQPELYNDLNAEQKKRVILKPFVPNLYEYTGAADMVIARAGATTIAELAVQHKACLFVPNPFLTGGQQPKNAKHLEANESAVIVSEETAATADKFYKLISDFILDDELREKLEYNIAALAKPDASTAIATLVLNEVKAKEA